MSKCFVKITNEEIYSRINDLDEKIDSLLHKHNKNSGKISKVMWVASTALTLSLFAIGYLIAS